MLLVDDQEIFRTGIRATIDAIGCCSSVLEAGTVEECIGIVESEKIDLVFIDASLPGDGVSTAQQLMAIETGLKVVILTGTREAGVRKALLRSGFSGYLAKTSPALEVADAIEAVYRGDVYVSPEIVRLSTPPQPCEMRGSSRGMEIRFSAQAEVDERFTAPETPPRVISPDTPKDVFKRLSEREFQAVVYLAQGYKICEASAEMGLSSKTVSTYKRRAFEKLGVENIAELIRLALLYGVISAS